LARLPFRALTLLAPLALALPSPASAARAPRAAVSVVEAPEALRDQLKGLRAVVEEELEQHEIKVLRKPVAPQGSGVKKLGTFARARRLDRVYDVRLLPEGKKVVVVLTERKAPAMKSTFSARLAAVSAEKVKAVLPKLVGAVVARQEPEPDPQPAAAAAPAEPVSPAPETAVHAAAPAPVRRTEWLVGASVELGSYLNAAAGIYGASGRLIYQRGALGVGLELGGGGGGGTAFHAGLRADYLFLSSGISPIVGAGLGYLLAKAADKAEGSGGYFSASVGVEYARLRPVRFRLEAEVYLPFFEAKRSEIQSVNGIVDLTTIGSYSPAAVIKLGCLY